jgi:hypothetical protein
MRMPKWPVRAKIAVMTIERINPADLHTTPGYHHVTVVDSGRLAFLAGQCPLRLDGSVVGAGRAPEDSDLDVAAALA